MQGPVTEGSRSPDETHPPPERLTFFSDAVVAIAITLLILDLPLPSGSTDHAVLRSIAHNAEAYWAFLISFAVIAAHWSGHHRLFRYVTRLGGRLFALNMIWLLLIVVTPYVTRVLTGDGAFPVRFSLYAGVQAALFVMSLLMQAEIGRQKLRAPDAPADRRQIGTWRAGTLAAAFALSIPVAQFTEYAYLMWVAVPFAARLLRRLRPALPERFNKFSSPA